MFPRFIASICMCQRSWRFFPDACLHCCNAVTTHSSMTDWLVTREFHRTSRLRSLHCCSAMEKLLFVGLSQLSDIWSIGYVGLWWLCMKLVWLVNWGKSLVLVASVGEEGVGALARSRRRKEVVNSARDHTNLWRWFPRETRPATRYLCTVSRTQI